MPDRRVEGSLRGEIKQTRPFDSRLQEALLGILKTADELRWGLGQILKDSGSGLSLEQYNVLRILRGAGGQGLPTLDIADRMVERSPAITRLLDKLETKGFILRERSAKDRRQVYCAITGAGLALIARLDGPISAYHHELLGIIGEEDLDGLISGLDRIRKAVAAK